VNQKQVAVEILKNVRELLATPGQWTQDPEQLGEPDKYCLFTATGVGYIQASNATSYVSKTAGMQLADATIFHMVSKRGAKQYDDLVDTIANWNDAPGRTLDEVLSVVDEAIHELQQTT